MFKKVLAVLLPVFFIFSVANAQTVEASTNQVTVRVDFLEEGTNKKLAESTVVSGNEGAFANIAIPQNLVAPYNITRRDFSAEAKQQIANNQIHNNQLVYQIFFSKKANYKPANPIAQITAIFSQVTTTQTTVAAVVPVTTHVSGSVSVSQTVSVTTSSQSSSSTTTVKKETAKKPVRKPVGKALEKAKRFKR